jgi:DNA-directed RNA polymerase subunit H (RpoH/RPB5)
MEILYEKYLNIQKFINVYRGYTMVEKFHDFASFKKIIQIEQFLLHKCTDVKNGKPVYIYIFRDQSKYIKTTPQFKRLMDKLPYDPSNVIVISKDLLSVYINKALTKYTHLRIFNYTHKFFAIELAMGPLCSKHTVLSNREVKRLCSSDLVIHPLSLPSIAVTDPQNIWVGGELGQIMKIESISEITGRTIRYRIISPDSGKMINIQKLKQKIQANEDIGIKATDSEKNMNNAKTVDDEVANDAEKASEYIDVLDEDEDES